MALSQKVQKQPKSELQTTGIDDTYTLHGDPRGFTNNFIISYDDVTKVTNFQTFPTNDNK